MPIESGSLLFLSFLLSWHDTPQDSKKVEVWVKSRGPDGNGARESPPWCQLDPLRHNLKWARGTYQVPTRRYANERTKATKGEKKGRKEGFHLRRHPIISLLPYSHEYFQLHVFFALVGQLCVAGF